MREGKPFSGAAGYTFNNWLHMLSLQRIDVMTSNAMWCKPARLHWTDYPNRYPDAAATLDHCRPHLDDLIERTQPKVIVPMGNVALRRVCGISGIEASAGYVLSTPYGIPAVPTYHPSFVMQGKQKLTAACVFAINRARSIAHGTYQPSQYELLLDPSPDRARAYLASAGRDRIPHLVVDIETPESDRLDEEEVEQEGVSWNIVRAGFSLRQGTAITFPWQQPYIGILQEALDRADEFIEHADNRFDSRRLAAAGLRLPARIVSSMWAWHFLESDLRKGLGLVAPFYYGGPPWKDQNAARPAWYNCLHGDTMIPLWDGSWKLLKDIVRCKLDVLLIGSAEDGRRIPVRITGWHRQKVVGQQWVRVQTDNGRQDIRCTPDHKIWTVHGWKRADQLVVGDAVKSAYFGSDDVIHGTTLGDGHISPRGYLSFSHCDRQKAWAQRKAGHFGSFLGKRISSGFKKGAVSWATEIAVGKRWRNLFYTLKGKRFVEPPTTRALAVWYCDDGCWAATNKLKHRGNPRFAAFGFTNFEAIVEYFERTYGSRVSIYNPQGSGASIALTGSAVDAFFTDICRSIPPEMQYKLPPRYRGMYDGWMEIPQSQWTVVTEVVSDERPKSASRYAWDYRYCVTVDHQTHRFFTMGGLVANCMDNAVTMDVYLGTRRILIDQGRWQAFERHCVKMSTPYYVMGSRGLDVDASAQSSFMRRIEEEWDATNARLQAAVPDELKPRKFWKRPPKDMTGVIELPDPHDLAGGNDNGGEGAQ